MLKKRSEEAPETAPLETQKPERKGSLDAVIVYITILFTVIFLLTLLSYKMHQRETEETISEMTYEHTMSEQELRQTIAKLKEENARLNDALETEKGEKRALQEEQNTLRAERDNAVAQCTAAEAELDSLKDTIQNLQAELEAVSATAEAEEAAK